ncbi:transposase [Rhodobacter sphaeroides]|uniref:Transposase and inactivated derivatives n=1 Tax=Cereibacter sphaeroides (strain ATCC 17023 / DSM 158 / JCM 6121 / CCUG 31486 / LMG 2827 / NBRC 12203 / NCIMB 8253 / ATH 2.4.1.) TaxID=272943 RepID=Q3IUX1_CERS4|nr:replication initiation protein RepC [Cereibacter sphaeroides]ABA81663.1 Transposase and inactivated derivatives [Cereibacter sphaeroides 2.4.1]AMJ49807.1 transposase [Cereibacter sphaeroides]ANS36566.1 transposase [Cereibacter sphaeroides]ATN65578.1 transposase [Cereibacter sphaeroides]AXC64185.1 transposase [Cereibacter sphaeroides 2.4.1]
MLSIQLQAEPEKIYPSLPGRFQRSDVERVVTACSAALGLSSACLRALLVMVHATRPSDWRDEQRDAVCFMQQVQVAARLGVTPRALRYQEARLERLGLLRRNVAADGSRGRFGGGDLIQGISFAPLIEAFPSLLRIAEQLEAAERERQVLRRRVSAARRILSQTLTRLAALDKAVPGLTEVLASMPRRYDALDGSELGALLQRVDKAAREALRHLEVQQVSSGVPENSFRPHIQDTTQENPVCSGSSAIERTARKRADSIKPDAAPDGTASCYEKKHGLADRGFKPRYLDTFTPTQLYEAASPDMQMYLDAGRRSDSTLTAHDFIQAAIAILPALGVNASAWDEAADTMGDLPAALCVLVLDANRYRPVNPVWSPGGMLRAMTARARSGGLNLHGSLIALQRRAG